MFLTSKTLAFTALVGLLVLNFFVFRTVFSPASLKVQVLSVGKGYAVLLQRPGGQTILIDTGPDASVLRALGEALPPWQRKIDEVILTSGAAAQGGGLSAVQSRYTVGSVAQLPTEKLAGKEVQEVVKVSYGDTTVVIDENTVASAALGRADLLISSSTPAAAYSSDGQRIYQQKGFFDWAHLW